MKSMNHFYYLVLAALVLSSCGERKARTKNPSVYNQAGVTFKYPSNWKVEDSNVEGEIRYLFVESPGDALVIIQIYPVDDALEIEDLAKTFAKSAKENTPIGNVSDSTFGSVTSSDGYEVLKENVTISILGQKVPHTRTYMRRIIGDEVCYIIDQIADEDRKKVQKGFDLISSSFAYKAP